MTTVCCHTSKPRIFCFTRTLNVIPKNVPLTQTKFICFCFQIKNVIAHGQKHSRIIPSELSYSFFVLENKFSIFWVKFVNDHEFGSNGLYFYFFYNGASHLNYAIHSNQMMHNRYDDISKSALEEAFAHFLFCF